MAKFEVEIDEKGDFVGQLPTELDAVIKRIEITAHGTGFRGGQSKAAEEAKTQIAKAIADEKARLEAEAPVRAAKFEQMEQDYKGIQTRILENERANSNAMREREETHARELLERSERQKKLSGRIIDLTKAQLRGEARGVGARDESLDELEVILHASIGYDDDMNPFVKNGDGTPRTDRGKPMSLTTFVKEYLDAHTHHRKAASGQGGGARGGASFHGHTGGSVSAESARARVEAGDRSASAIDELFQATRKKST